MSMSDQTILYGAGMGGLERVTGTGSGVNGPWVAIQALASTVVASLAGSGLTGTFAGMTIGANQVIYGQFSAITLTSGDVILYRGGILP